MYLPKQLFYRTLDSFMISKEKGIRAVFTELGRIGARIFYQHAEYLILAHTLSACATSAGTPSGLTIRQATTRDLIASLGPIVGSADMARFYKLLEAGSIGFIASDNCQTVGCCWASQEADPSVNRVQAALPLCPGDAYMHDLFVSPTYQRRGIGQSLLTHCLEYLHESGYKRAVAAVDKDNFPSLELTSKTGFKVIGELSHVRTLFGNHFKCRITDL